MNKMTVAEQMILDKVIGKYEKKLLRLLVLLEKYEKATGYKKDQTVVRVEEIYRKIFAEDRKEITE